LLISQCLLLWSQHGLVATNSKELGEKNHLILLRGEMPQFGKIRVGGVAKYSNGPRERNSRMIVEM